MKRAPLSKGELLLLTLPVAVFGLFAAWQTAARLKAPTTLQSAPFTLNAITYGRNGKQIFAYGAPTDSQGRVQPNSYPVFLTWDTKSGDLKRQSVETRQIYYWSVSPDGRFLARADLQAKAVFIKDLQSNLETVNFPFDRGAFDWTPDSKSIIVHGRKAKMQIFDAQTGKLQRTIDMASFLPGTDGIQFCRFSRDSKLIAFLEHVQSLSDKKSANSQEERGYIKGRVAIATWPQLKKVTIVPGELCSDMVFSTDSSKISSVHSILGGYKTLGLVLAETDLQTKRTRWTRVERAPLSSSLFNIRLSPDAHLFATPNQSGFELWKVSDGKFVGEIPPIKDKNRRYQERPRFSPDSRFLIRANGNEVERYDLTRFLPLQSP